jgi:hypothetical protein
MVTADSVKAKLQGLIDKANETTGNADTDLTTAVDSLVSGFGQGGEEVYSTPTGVLYKKNHIITQTAEGNGRWNSWTDAFAGAEHMESFSAPETTSKWSGYYTFAGCGNLKKVYLPKITQLGTYMPFRSAPSIEEMQIGSIGYPISAPAYEFGGSCAAIVTLYVADDVSIPLSGSPWGWRNATFIYRSATTGEVRTA